MTNFLMVSLLVSLTVSDLLMKLALAIGQSAVLWIPPMLLTNVTAFTALFL